MFVIKSNSNLKQNLTLLNVYRDVHMLPKASTERFLASHIYCVMIKN